MSEFLVCNASGDDNESALGVALPFTAVNAIMLGERRRALLKWRKAEIGGPTTATFVDDEFWWFGEKFDDLDGVELFNDWQRTRDLTLSDVSSMETNPIEGQTLVITAFGLFLTAWSGEVDFETPMLNWESFLNVEASLPLIDRAILLGDRA